MIANYTPGPWFLQEGFNTIYTTSEPSNHTGITIALAKVLDHQCRASEVAPNARLIAAAPELVDALRECAGWLPLVPGHEAGSTTDILADRIAALLARIDGETQ